MTFWLIVLAVVVGLIATYMAIVVVIALIALAAIVLEGWAYLLSDTGDET
jgi:uncharacterized membrane protein